MSIQIMSQVWTKELAGNDLLVLLAFADHANDEGICWPSIGAIAWKTGLSERSVQRLVRAYQEQGVLVVKRAADPGTKTPTIYQMRVENLPSRPPRDRGDTVTPVPGRGDKSDTGGVTNDAGRGDKSSGRGDTAMSPKPSVESSSESSDSESSPPTPPRGDARKTSRINRPVAYTEAFEQLWALYPKNGGSKKPAFQAYQRIERVEDHHGAIMADVLKRIPSRQWQEGYAPHLSTYLNQRRWEDGYGAQPDPEPAQATMEDFWDEVDQRNAQWSPEHGYGDARW